jgi:hypothetical protein
MPTTARELGTADGVGPDPIGAAATLPDAELATRLDALFGEKAAV